MSVTFEISSMNEKRYIQRKKKKKQKMNEKDRQENRSCNPFLPLWVQCKRRKIDIDRC